MAAAEESGRTPGVAPSARLGSLQWPLLRWYAGTGAMGALVSWLLLGYWQPRPPVAFLALAAAAGAAVATVAGYRVTWSLKRRIRPLTQGVAIFAAGGMRHRIEVDGDDEVSDLARALNGLAERHARQVDALQRMAEERVRLGGEAARAAVLEERQRLARDLHDAVSQAIFSIAMTTAAARRLMAQDPERAAVRIAEAESLAATAQREMRALLLELRPVELAGRPLADALRQFLGELGARHEVATRFAVEREGEGEAEGEGAALGAALEDGLFRIGQEAVMNAIRHAAPTRVEVRLLVDAARARLIVQDDGKGFDPAAAVPDAHFGLASMRERAQELGGALTVRSTPSHGTDVEVSVPRVARTAHEGE